MRKEYSKEVIVYTPKQGRYLDQTFEVHKYWETTPGKYTGLWENSYPDEHEEIEVKYYIEGTEVDLDDLSGEEIEIFEEMYEDKLYDRTYTEDL